MYIFIVIVIAILGATLAFAGCYVAGREEDRTDMQHHLYIESTNAEDNDITNN